MINPEEIVDLIEHEVLATSKDITVDTKLFSTGLLDSLQLTSLFLSLEKKYQVTIGPFDVSQENFDSATQIARWVNMAKNG